LKEDMKIKRITLGFLVLSLLACNFVTQMVIPATVTPTATASPTPTTTPLSPAYIPPECGTAAMATVEPNVLQQATPEFKVTEISKDEQLEILKRLALIVKDVYV
jgi:hypothetical protein